MLPRDHKRRCYVPRRFILLFLVAVAVLVSALFRQVLSITMNSIKARENWTDDDITMTEFSFLWGYAATCIFGGYISYRHGFKAVLGIGVVLNSLTTTLAPFAMGSSLTWLIVCRCVAGAAEVSGKCASCVAAEEKCNATTTHRASSCRLPTP